MAEIIGAKIIGDNNAKANGLNEIHVVRAGDVTFVDHPKYYNKVLGSDASVIIINKEFEAPEGKVLLLHDKPFAAFNSLIQKYRPFVASKQNVSISAKYCDW